MYQLDPLYCTRDEDLLLDYVICGDAELLYLDTILRETLSRDC
jgi:hypothetical protein